MPSERYEVRAEPDVSVDLRELATEDERLVDAALVLMVRLRNDPWLGEDLWERYNMKPIKDCRKLRFDLDDWLASRAIGSCIATSRSTARPAWSASGRSGHAKTWSPTPALSHALRARALADAPARSLSSKRLPARKEGSPRWAGCACYVRSSAASSPEPAAAAAAMLSRCLVASRCTSRIAIAPPTIVVGMNQIACIRSENAIATSRSTPTTPSAETASHW